MGKGRVVFEGGRPQCNANIEVASRLKTVPSDMRPEVILIPLAFVRMYE